MRKIQKGKEKKAKVNMQIHRQRQFTTHFVPGSGPSLIGFLISVVAGLACLAAHEANQKDLSLARKHFPCLSRYGKEGNCCRGKS